MGLPKFTPCEVRMMHSMKWESYLPLCTKKMEIELYQPDDCLVHSTVSTVFSIKGFQDQI